MLKIFDICKIQHTLICRKFFMVFFRVKKVQIILA